MEVWLFNIVGWPYRAAGHPLPMPASAYDTPRGRQIYEDCIALDLLDDELGYDGVCFAEHHYGTISLTPSPNLMAAAMATHTTNAKIMLMGNCLPLHGHPVRVAEELAMIDVLSGGRLVSGFIRGGSREYTAYGIPPEHGRDLFTEAADLIIKAWTETEPFAWHGAHFNYDVVSILPRPVQQPHPPIWIGGTGPKRLIPIAAKWADVWHAFGTPNSLAETKALLERLAEENGRDPASITKAGSLSISEPIDTVKRHVEKWRDAGYGYVVCGWPEEGRARVEEVAAKVLPEFAD